MNLPNRIANFKSELLKIIKGQKYSEFRVNTIKRIQEIGASKVNNPLFQINYFESLLVSINCHIYLKFKII